MNLHKNMNVGLLYEINDEHNIMGFSNLTNLIEGQELSYEPTFNIDLISEYYTCINTCINYNSYEDHVEDLVGTTDCKFPEDAESFFQDQLNQRPDTSGAIESWTYLDVDQAHLRKEKQDEILKVLENLKAY